MRADEDEREEDEDERGGKKEREENPSTVFSLLSPPFHLLLFSSLRPFVRFLLLLLFLAACFIIRPCSPFSIPLQGSPSFLS